MSNILKVLSAGFEQSKYIENVFSTNLYTGNGSTQSINNGVNLSGTIKGGLVWIKGRSGATDHALYDTARGATYDIGSNLTTGQTTQATGLTSFNSNGFSISSLAKINTNNAIYAAWTFRKQAKFFDVVTYTGNGSNRTIAHNLGSVPGCIIVKRTDTTGDWQVYHRSLSNTEYLVLNSTAAKATGTTRWNSTTPTATEFSLGTDATVNANTGTYVAYLFAHNAGGFGNTLSDSIISCGSYTASDYSNAPDVNLGWEPQWLLIKNATTTANAWLMFDNMRGIPTGASDVIVSANASSAETAPVNYFELTPTGFKGATANSGTDTFIYVAVRRGPMNTPADANKVFMPTVYTGTNADNRLVDTTIAPDMVWVRQRDDTVLTGMVVGDRLRGQPYLLTGGSASEVNDLDAFDAQLVSATEYGTAFSSMIGFWCGNDITAKLNANTTSNNHIVEAFKRAPGFFDVVCYTGNATARTIAHNLGAVPELMIVKNRNGGGGGQPWAVYAGDATDYLVLNTNAATADDIVYWNDTTPTSSVFTVGTGNQTNKLNETYVAYLFASLSRISKIGTYTGNGGTVNNDGTSQTINCGFGAGARFVLIKRTDSTGDWYVFDSARGIVAGNDPYLLANSTAAEVTTVDAVDADNGGFIVNQTSGTNLNVTGATYIYLAIA